jgi:uncharacterized protein YabE (DUF348 family)
MPTNIKIGEKFSFPLKRSIAFAIMIVICVSSVITVMAADGPAYVVDNGNKIQVDIGSLLTPLTADKIIEKAVADNKMKSVGANDKVDFDKNVTVTVCRAISATVKADGTTQTVAQHYEDTVQNALTTAGITLNGVDSVTPSKDTKLTAGMVITVARQQKVSITADGKTNSYSVPTGTVEKALSVAGITLGKDDVLNVEKTAQVTPDMKINVNRVVYKDVTTTQAVAYKTTTQKTNTLTLGTTKIQTAGKNGSQTVVSRQTLVDGKLTQTKVISTAVTQQPVDQVKLMGIKVKPSNYATITADGTLLDQSGKEVQYKKYYSGRCTAYTSNGGHTATGAKAQYGYVAVNPNLIPYGTRLYICSADGKTVYGYAIASDTGGGAMSGAILSDLYYDTESQCRNFGVRTMRLYVLS